jgi:peptide/nickel transport system permease protein
MKRARFFVQRLIRLGVVLASVVVLTFGMVHLTPGDPARAIAGAQADESAVAIAREEFGLDRPLPEQFASYVAGLVQGDLGRSFKTREPVSDIIAGRAGPTYALAIAALVMITLVGLTVGLLAGIASRRRGRAFEAIFSAVTGGLAAMPHYLTATFLVFLFAVTWTLFPVAGSTGLTALVLPAAAVALRPAMMVARVVRVRTLEVVEQPYIRTARSKRISPTRLYLRHVLPNAVTAALALGGVLFASLIGGAVVVELVFGRAGLGTELVRSVIAGDYPVVQGITLVLGATVVTVNLAVDVLLGVLDPKTVES